MPPSTLFESAIQVQPQGSNTYSADLKWDWSVGTVPNGGYIAAIFYRVATTHFHTKHPKSHTGRARPISMQLSYIRRCKVGPAVLRIEDIKLGARISLVHVTLLQEGRPAVAGYLTMSDVMSEIGISIPKNWNVCDLSLGSPPLEDNNRSEWKKVIIPHPIFRRASSRVELYERADRSTLSKSVGQWARLRPQGPSGKVEAWTMESVAFLCDILSTVLGPLERTVQESKRLPAAMAGEPVPVWFPTLAFNIDFKRCAFTGSHEWLFSHLHIKSVQNGRMDVEVVIVDTAGELVAVATQVALVMSSERNLAKRSTNGNL